MLPGWQRVHGLNQACPHQGTVTQVPSAYPDRMPYVVGALGSRPVPSKGLGRNAGGPGGGNREPKGKRHAVDADTGEAACGTFDALRVFDDWPWSADGDWCANCAAVVPFE